MSMLLSTRGFITFNEATSWCKSQAKSQNMDEIFHAND